MRFHALCAAVGATVILSCNAAFAQDRATRDDAIAFVNEAVAHVEKVGVEKAFADFNDKSNMQWRRKDLYVFVDRADGMALVHGANEKLVGKNLWELKDQDGKLFVQAMIQQAKQGPGWVEYEWSHPQTKKVEGKASYVRWLPQADAMLGAGVYR